MYTGRCTKCSAETCTKLVLGCFYPNNFDVYQWQLNNLMKYINILILSQWSAIKASKFIVPLTLGTGCLIKHNSHHPTEVTSLSYALNNNNKSSMSTVKISAFASFKTEIQLLVCRSKLENPIIIIRQYNVEWMHYRQRSSMRTELNLGGIQYLCNIFVFLFV